MHTEIKKCRHLQSELKLVEDLRMGKIDLTQVEYTI